MDTSGTVAPSKVTINGQEYDPAQASDLISLGNKYRELETKWNTSLDKVYPEYTRATQERAELQKRLSEREQKISEYEAKQKQSETPEEKRRAIEAARGLGLVDDEALKQRGYLTKADLETYYQERQKEQSAVNQVLDQAKHLEKEIDGADGKVPFNQKAVLAYASAYNISDLRTAYDEMNGDTNKKWAEAVVSAHRKPGLRTIKSGGEKTPPAPRKLNDSNVSEALKEALWGSEE